MVGLRGSGSVVCECMAGSQVLRPLVRAAASILQQRPANSSRWPCKLSAHWLQEFINYFFLQRAASSAADSGEDWRLHAEVGTRFCLASRRAICTGPWQTEESEKTAFCLHVYEC